MHAFKSYTNFTEMVNEMIYISSDIKEIISSKDGNLPETFEQASKNVLELISMNVPEMLKKNSYSCSINCYELGFKTKNELSFGWKVNIDENGKIEYKARITLSCNPVIARKTTEMVKAIELGYRLIEKTFKERSIEKKNA